MKKVFLSFVSILVFATVGLAQQAVVQTKPAGALTAIFSGTAHQVALGWTASTTSGVTYNLYRGTATGSETKLVTGISAVTFTDTTVTNGTTYFYYVTAQLGAEESAGSNEVNATVPTNPAPPTGLTVSSVQ